MLLMLSEISLFLLLKPGIRVFEIVKFQKRKKKKKKLNSKPNADASTTF